MKISPFILVSWIAAIVTILGFGSSLIRAASYTEMEELNLSLHVCKPKFSEWLNLIEFANKHSNSVVLFDANIFFDGDRCNTDLLHRTEYSGSISAGSQYYLSPRLTERAEELFQRAPRDLVQFIPDNGTAIRLVKSELSLNRFTEFQFDVEGLEDRFRGPVQISFTSEDAFNLVEISYPIVSDADLKAMECVSNVWNLIERAIYCPFL